LVQFGFNFFNFFLIHYAFFKFNGFTKALPPYLAICP
jgi:hypothetical protein